MFQLLLCLLMTISSFQKISSKDLEEKIYWNKYKCEIATQTKNNNLAYLTDPTFQNINRLFILSLKNGNNDSARNSFEKYYIPLIEIKVFNVLIDKIPFFINH